MKKTKLFYLALLAYAFITNVYAETKPNPNVPMPVANPVTAKVAIPAVKTGEQAIPVLPKDVSGNKDKAYAGDNLAIIRNQESNKPLPVKKKIPIKKISENHSNSATAQPVNEKKSGGLKVIENGTLSTENFNSSASDNSNLPVNPNGIINNPASSVVANKDNKSIAKKNVKSANQNNINSNSNLSNSSSTNVEPAKPSNSHANTTSNMTEHEKSTTDISNIKLKEELDMLRKEVQDLKKQIKAKK
jgi:hypothetical protein